MSKVIDQLFEGVDGLSPEFKEKVQVVFEAAVQEATDAGIAAKAIQLTESSELQTTKNINEQNVQVLETLDVYLAEAVQEWVSENVVTIDSKLKTEIAESFVDGLADLFAKHNVTIDEATVSKVEELEVQLSAAQQALTEATDKIGSFEQVKSIESRKTILESKTAKLADTTKDRVTRIVESMEFKSDEDFSKKLGYIVEAVSGVADDATDDEGADDKDKDKAKDDKAEEKADDADKSKDEAPSKDVTEAVESVTSTVTLDPVVEQTLAYMRRTARPARGNRSK